MCLETNVGTGVDSTAQGMSVNGAGISRPDITDYKPPSSVSRPHIAKTKEPVRGRGMREIRGKDRVEIAERTKEMQEGAYEETEPVEPKQEAYIKDEELPDILQVGEDDEIYFDEAPQGAYFDESLGDSLEPPILRRKKKPVNRTRLNRNYRRGGDNPTTLRGLRP